MEEEVKLTEMQKLGAFLGKKFNKVVELITQNKKDFGDYSELRQAFNEAVGTSNPFYDPDLVQGEV